LKKLPFKWREISRTIKAFVESSDILWVRVPTLLLELILNEARLQNKPVVIHIASNLRGLWKSSKHKGLKKIPVRIMSEIIHRRSRKTLLHETVLATGPELVDIFSGEGRNVTPFVDSLVGAPKVINSFKPGTGRLIFVGRVDHGKGLFVTLRALKRIKDIGRRVSLSVVGEGPILETLKKEACVLEVDEMITWRGFIPYGEELDCEYEKNHILLLPSESTEGFPRVILEAWAKGVAVIASNIGGMGRIIRNGIDGILVPPSNDIALANAILQLTDKTELRSEIVRNSYRSLEPWTLQNQSFIAADTLKKAYAKVFGCDFL
jgi:glycosyltransferase involved in cell wall biosynthesis